MITYSNTPANANRTVDTPPFEDWGPNNGANSYTTNVYYYPASGGLLFAPTINFRIKDVVGNPAYAQYTEFRLKANQAYAPGNPSQWLSSICYIGGAYPNFNNVVMLTENGVTYSFTPVFQNIGLLAYGNYSFYHNFIIEGRLASGVWQLVSAYTHALVFHLSNQPVTYTPNILSYQHIANTTLPFQTVAMNGEAWSIVGNMFFELSSATPGVTIETLSQTINGITADYQIITGSGAGTVEIKLTDFYNNTASPDGLMTQGTFNVISGTTFIGYINYNVTVSNIATFGSTPTTLNFFAVKGVEESDAQNIIYTCTEAITVTKSPWLTAVQDTLVINGSLLTIVIVKPIGTANMQAGVYTGFVTLSTTIGGVPSSRTIVVTYTIQDFISVPYNQGNNAFTLDQDFISFSSANVDTYMQLNAEIKTHDFFTNVEHTTIIPQKIVLFQGKAKINIGYTVHQLMDKFKEVNGAIFQYKPAIVKLICEERKNSDFSLIRDTITHEIPFVAGLSLGIKTIGFLEINKKPDRATRLAYAYLNMLIPAGTFYLETKRNGVSISQALLPNANGTILTKRVFFDTFTQGDVISFGILSADPLARQPEEKVFEMLPEGKYSHNIAWENDFLLQSVLEFHGVHKVQTDYEFQTQKLYENLVEVLRILDYTKTVKFSINTGWLVATSLDTVESLIRSKRAWLINPAGNINLRPISKTIINQDSERELVEYSIEFEINKKYNEETYSF